MKGHVSAIVRINSGGGNNRASNGIRITEVWLGINIESIFFFAVDGGLNFFERRPKLMEELGMIRERWGGESDSKKAKLKRLPDD